MDRRVSINCLDDTIVVDGESLLIDCSGLRAAGISAVQWDGDAGHIEYIKHAKPNEAIEDFDAYLSFVDDAYPRPQPAPPVYVEDELGKLVLKEG
jgi:hypothetical protein